MADTIDNNAVSPVQASSEDIQKINANLAKPGKNVHDWFREPRMSADVNATTVGVDTDHVTPELLLATSRKLLKINRREAEPDAKDSLQFQRIYGPADFIAEHVLRDADRLGRQLLWKATNRGNVDFMPTAALDQHVSDVFNSSKLANMIDGSSPLETIEASYKVTRIGEGGVSSVDSAPVEMRLVQPSFLGYLDAVATPECYAEGTELMTENGWKAIEDITTDDVLACLVNGDLEWHNPTSMHSYETDGQPMYKYLGHVGFWVTQEHRMYVRTDRMQSFDILYADELYNGNYEYFDVICGLDGKSDIRRVKTYAISMGHESMKVYCPTVPGGLVYCRYKSEIGFWCGNSLRVGLDGVFTKHCMKGSDGKLYQKFINARTGKEELVDSVTAAKSVVTTPDMMAAKTNHIYAVGGRTGVRIVDKKDVDYYLPRMDDAFSNASNMVTGLSGVKELRLRMGCLHPLTNVLVVSRRNEVSILPAKDVNTSCGMVPVVSDGGATTYQPIRTTVAKFPLNRAWFKKVVLYSGRTLITSRDHRWSIIGRDGETALVPAEKLKQGDRVMRTVFHDIPSRRTFVNGVLVNRDVATLLGYVVRTLANPDDDKLTVTYQPRHADAVRRAVAKLGADVKFYTTAHRLCLSMTDGWFHAWAREHVGVAQQDRRIPSEILSANLDMVACFLDAYAADETQVAQDELEYIWILNIPNTCVRDGLAFLLARTGTDTFYRDAYLGSGEHQLALKLVDMNVSRGDVVVDEVKAVLPIQNAAVMIDIDVDDQLYAVASGIVTHNSKYPQQAVSIEGREAPLVRGLDEQSGKDMQSTIGRYLGARYAKKPGTVTAVRKDRVDMLYDDGTKGSIALYHNYPMNAKGFITNEPAVKAGMHLDEGDLVASSNYTDKDGVAALGTNLRIGWLSWHGGTYEDAIVISEDAAKKMTSTTMYSKDLDLDRTVTLGKKNYLSWKPGEFNKEQLAMLDDEGVVKPGSVLRKGDPMVLAVQTTEPSPGTMGKRVLTDVSEVWDHDHPGVVTDIVRTRSGVRVLATVTAPCEVGDKLANGYGNKGVVAKILPVDEMPKDADGKPLDIIMSPLGLVSRTNATQLDEAMLGKVAHKTGRPITIPAFYNGNRHEYVLDQLKQHRLQADDDFFDPDTGRKIPKVINGYSYIYKLKHMSEAKESGRGTGEYTMDDTAGGSGYEGCFPAMQDVMTLRGRMSIATICEKRRPEHVLTWTGADWAYRRITDWFTYRADVDDILAITTEYTLNYADHGRAVLGHSNVIYPTKNHKMYRADMTEALAGDLRVGDTLAGIGAMATHDQEAVIIGTLLGDASLTADNELQCEHALAQQNWLTWKYEALKGLWATMSASVYNTSWTDRSGVKRTGKGCGMRVPHSALLGDIRTFMYRGKKRCITQTALDRLGELGFCVWFLDDGGMHNRTKAKGKPAPEASLATHGFTLDEVRLACTWLDKLTGVPEGAKLWYDTSIAGEKMAGIRFIREASWRIAEIVARNIPWTAIPASKQWLRAWCRDRQMAQPVRTYDFVSRLGVVPIRITNIARYKHDKPGVSNIPVYDFTVEDTHRYTLSGGILVSNSKRLGGLEVSAMVGHSAFDNLLDAHLIRGQSNADFWRSIRTGGIPTIPGEPLVQKKFFAHLQGAGVNVRKTPKGISIFALSNPDVDALTGPRELKSKATYEARNFRPIDGGLFSQDVFGMEGDKWGYIQLDEPLPNPVMAEPLARLLRMSDRDFAAVASGTKTVDGMSSGADLKERLSRIDLERESKAALQEFRNAPASKRDAAMKRYVAIERMNRQGVQPSEYMLDRIPVLPPIFRPVSSSHGLTMVSDANYLYAQILDARDDLRDAKDLPREYQDKARANLYNKWQELTGLYDPEDVKLRNKNVGGLLQWALGKGSPKFSAVQRKVIGTSVDTVGRGVIVPDSRLTVDEIGIPVSMAFGIMAPFVTRALVKRGYSTVDAMKMVKRQDRQAMDALEEIVSTHPVEMNRAPSLHKFNILAFKPRLVQGHAIHVHPSICPGFAADFDGDTVANSTRIWIDLKILGKKVKKSGEKCLTRPESGVYYSRFKTNNDSTTGANTMISKQTRCMLASATGPLSEIPVVPGSEVHKSPTVTEWDVPEGFYTDTVNPETGETGLARITKVSRHTGLKMFDCVLSSRGSYKHVVTASEDHSLITLDATTLGLEKTRPEDAVGKLVPRVVYNDGNSWEICSDFIHISKDLPATHKLGYAIGAILGDGWIDVTMTLRLACCNKSLQDYFTELFAKDNSPFPVEKDAVLWTYDARADRMGQGQQQRFTIYATKEFKAELKQLIGAGAENKRIPEDCFMGSRAHLAGILMGLLDTDGTVNFSKGTISKKSACKTVMVHTVSPQLRDGIQELCTRLGIRTSATPYTGPNSTMTCYAVNLSLMDLAREAQRTPSLFVLHHSDKNDTLHKIIDSVKSTEATVDLDFVPFPAVLRSEFIYAGVNSGAFKDIFQHAIKNGYIARKTAAKMARIMETAAWDVYKEPRNVYERLRHYHTPAEALELVTKWIELVRNTRIAWETVDTVTPATCTEGWDCTVPGPYTFTLATGTVVQDTVNIHVPVSDAARKEAMDRMRPSRNLLTLANHKIMNKPEKEYMQGLYIATRMGKSPDGRARIFRTFEEAREAYRNGEIDVDTPINIIGDGARK